MDLTQDKIDLISRIIKSDRKFSNNEDLFDDFFNETCKRSVAIMGVVDSELTLESYLKRIVTTSIINVLKDSGRLRRTGAGYMSTKEIVADTNETIDYSGVNITYANINIPKNPEEIVIQRDILRFVAETIKNIDMANPDESFLQLYHLRYDKGMTQKEISDELGISQSEVSKRLYKLMDKVKAVIE
ncbi:MAG: sigma-70 family RNA polymerase sigma factor [Cyanobacteria bacterium SIG26]|nr:sigma-70 family RNA polymerase sigma factor [Cyanobacteria bacterium SIG26]